MHTHRHRSTQIMSLWGYQLFQIEISMCVCVCVFTCVGGWMGRSGCKITENRITLESIEINQFCFMIFDLWKNLHLCGLKVVGHLGVVGCLGDCVCVCVCVCDLNSFHQILLEIPPTPLSSCPPSLNGLCKTNIFQ